MRNFILIALTTIFLSAGAQQKRPNVIFILTDQWRASALAYAGNEVVKTPELDKFANAAVNFKNAVSVLPVCTPYRASLLTGRYPTTTGMFLNDVYLPEEELCMAEIYRQANYKTAYLGKWHLDAHGRFDNVDPSRRQGFDFWKGSECDHDYLNELYYENDNPDMKHWEGYSTNAISKEAQNFMEAHSKGDDSFLLFVSIGTPHFPHETAPKKYRQMYKKGKLKLPENVSDNMKERALKELQGYYAHCTATDKAIGDIIEKAKELGIYENSIIVFTSDHGEMMGAHGFKPWMKHQAYAESANIPFLISYPAMGANAGKTAKAAITTPDILPSLLTLCNIETPGSVEGYDLSNIIRQPDLEKDRAALYMNVCPFEIAFSDDEYRALKTSKYTYVKTPRGPSMLFNDIADPLQMNNLIKDSFYADVKKELDAKLKVELERIGETEEVKPRSYYLKKFGFEGKKELRDDYAIIDYNKVEVVVSPKKQIRHD